MADASAHVTDEVNKWWETFNNGGAAEDEPMVDSDSDFEQGEHGAEEEEEDAGLAAGECGRKVDPDAHALAGTAGSSGAARDCNGEEVSEDGHFQLEGVPQGMKTEAAAGPNTPRAEIQNEEGQEEYVSEDNYVGGEFRG
ncbi:uncharacterized protein LOC123442680 isoform X2 [Hordeum vulgare subsp. vulgare]|uniref:uncharacterized protein LOC123442680 isoform X2 n=1 Tax=Hordeum vulgare subsp. vulgare TaxID=112509 RepID=UPI001D1A5801|nr:uncharacterized protein LOC123442680 isoform X2 [Hordeum vulgare subsp. vulgare]